MRFFLVLSIISSLSLRAQAELVEQVVAIVNDKIITETDIRNLNTKLKNKGMVDDLFIQNPAELINDRKKSIEALISERIIDSEVKRNSSEVTLERVEQEIRSVATKNNMNRNQLKQALKDQGVDFADYQDFLKKRLERQSLIDKVVSSRIKISDEEVASFYIANKSAGSGQESYEYTLAHIFFVPKSGDVDGAKARAEQVETKLKSGQAFESLASQYSEDPNYAAGGILGTFKSGEFTKELEDAVKPLSVNGLSGVIKSKSGFHIVKVLNKKLISDPVFEKAKEEIRSQLYQVAFKKQFAFWLEQKRQEAFIRIN